jgi:hypothetical protein
MTTFKQFLTLFRFQSTVNPYIWFMPLAFATTLFIPYIHGLVPGNYHPGFTSLFSNQNLFFIAIFGTSILAPEKYQFGNSALMSSYFGNEFLLTRAVDRPIVYRAKIALLYLLVLAIPLLGIAQSVRNRDLIVTEYSKPVQQLCLAQVPGSSLLPPDRDHRAPTLIAIPNGNVWVAEWNLWVFVTAALTMQLLIILLYPYRRGKVVFWIVYFGFILVPLFDLVHFARNDPTVNEELFFAFAGHPWLAGILTTAVFISAQLWCERRFAQLEQ